MGRDIGTDFASLLTPHLGALYGHALSLTRNRQEAEDLVQETALKAHRAYETQFEKGTNIKAWLFKILRNTFINLYRKKVRAGEQVPIEDDNEFSFYAENFWRAKSHPEVYVQPENINHRLILESLSDEVKKALESLPREYRETLLLCDVQEFSYEEISKILHVPIGTVRSRISRARGALNKSLWDYAKDHGVLRRSRL